MTDPDPEGLDPRAYAIIVDQYREWRALKDRCETLVHAVKNLQYIYGDMFYEPRCRGCGQVGYEHKSDCTLERLIQESREPTREATSPRGPEGDGPGKE